MNVFYCVQCQSIMENDILTLLLKVPKFAFKGTQI